MKSYSLENSLRESIFREDLFLYNCLEDEVHGDVLVEQAHEDAPLLGGNSKEFILAPSLA